MILKCRSNLYWGCDQSTHILIKSSSLNKKTMSTEINYFGEFTSSIIISEDRYKYLEDAGVEIISCELYDAKPKLKDTEAFLIHFKVSNMTFLHFFQAGIKYSMDKYYKP